MTTATHLGESLADFLARPATERNELIHGRLVPKASPSGAHGGVEAAFTSPIFLRFNRKSGGPGGPGGWWIKTETSVHYPAENCIFDHDVVGWKRARTPEDPRGFPVASRPDWVCEIMLTTWKNDLEIKFEALRQAGVPHYWVADVERRILTVFELEGDKYTVAHVLEPAHRARAIRPFDAVELDVAALFGADPE